MWNKDTIEDIKNKDEKNWKTKQEVQENTNIDENNLSNSIIELFFSRKTRKKQNKKENKKREQNKKNKEARAKEERESVKRGDFKERH